MSKRIALECPICDGEGGHQEIIDPYLGGPRYECGACDGEGQIGPWSWISIQYWTGAPTWLTLRHADVLHWLWQQRWRLADRLTGGKLSSLVHEDEVTEAHMQWMTTKDRLVQMKYELLGLRRKVEYLQGRLDANRG